MENLRGCRAYPTSFKPHLASQNKAHVLPDLCQPLRACPVQQCTVAPWDTDQDFRSEDGCPCLILLENKLKREWIAPYTLIQNPPTSTKLPLFFPQNGRPTNYSIFCPTFLHFIPEWGWWWTGRQFGREWLTKFKRHLYSQLREQNKTKPRAKPWDDFLPPPSFTCWPLHCFLMASQFLFLAPSSPFSYQTMFSTAPQAFSLAFTNGISNSTQLKANQSSFIPWQVFLLVSLFRSVMVLPFPSPRLSIKHF